MKLPTSLSTIIRLISLALVASIGVGTVASAATTQSTPTTNSAEIGQALEIAPPVLNVTANPGETVNLAIKLRNISSGKLIVKGQANDFVAAGEEGIPKIVLEEGEPNPYSLKTWVTELPTVALEQRKVTDFPVKLNVPANAAPGGYYGVIRFTASAPDLKDNGVSLSASLGALVLLRVNGDAKEELSIAEFAAAKDGRVGTVFQSLPIKFVERVKNSGSIHEQPSGQITITDMFGKKVAVVNVNLPPRNILPASIRRFEQVLDKDTLGEKQLFGKYKASLKMTYGSKSQTVTDEVTFWVIPYTLIAVIIIGLIVGFFVLRTTIKRYNAHIIGRSRHRRR